MLPHRLLAVMIAVLAFLAGGSWTIMYYFLSHHMLPTAVFMFVVSFHLTLRTALGIITYALDSVDRNIVPSVK